MLTLAGDDRAEHIYGGWVYCQLLAYTESGIQAVHTFAAIHLTNHRAQSLVCPPRRRSAPALHNAVTLSSHKTRSIAFFL